MQSNRDRIKNKILSLDAKKWKADPFDVRYFLISKLKDFRSKIILDVGGGIGIIESEMDKSNFRVNIDTSIDDLKTCILKTDSTINPICASMLFLPFRDNVFDIVISSHIIELAKLMDISNNNDKKNNKNSNMKKVTREKFRILKNKGILFLTTPNYEYNKSPNKLTFSELNELLKLFFNHVSIKFFNTLPKMTKRRKLNFANIVPKIKTKLGKNPDEMIDSLIKEKSRNYYSVYFFATAKKDY